MEDKSNIEMEISLKKKEKGYFIYFIILPAFLLGYCVEVQSFTHNVQAIAPKKYRKYTPI